MTAAPDLAAAARGIADAQAPRYIGIAEKGRGDLSAVDRIAPAIAAQIEDDIGRRAQLGGLCPHRIDYRESLVGERL